MPPSKSKESMSKLLNMIAGVEITAFMLKTGWPDIFPNFEHDVDGEAADRHENLLKRLERQVEKLKEYGKTIAKPSPAQAVVLLKAVQAMTVDAHTKAIEKIARKKGITAVTLMNRHTECWKGNKKTKCKDILDLAISLDMCLVVDAPNTWTEVNGWT